MRLSSVKKQRLLAAATNYCAMPRLKGSSTEPVNFPPDALGSPRLPVRSSANTIFSIACAMAAMTVAGAHAAGIPVAPSVPVAPALPSFQEEISPAYSYGTTTFSNGGRIQNITKVPAQFGSGGYTAIRDVLAVSVPPSTSDTSYSLAAGPDSVATGQLEAATLGNNIITYTSTPVAIPVWAGGVVGALAESTIDYPMLITQSVTIANGSSNFATGSYGFNNGNGPSSSGYANGLFSVGAGGYAWLKVSSSGTLSTEGAFASGQRPGGTYIGSAFSIGSNVAAPTAPFTNNTNGGGPPSGYGILNLAGGTWDATNSPVFVGFQGAEGFVTNDGGKINLISTSLIMGSEDANSVAGVGTMVVENSGTLSLTGTGGYVALGRSVGSAGATGKLYVTGSGSTASVSQGILVGDGGYGFLAILNGGEVTSASAYAAGGAKTYGVTTQPGSGNIVIDGVSSSWTVSGNADFGETGVASVTVQNHGDLNILGTLTLGDQSTGSGTLTLQADGTIESGDATLGNQAGATGFANVSDINTVWTVDGDLTVGSHGQGSLTLSNSAQITTTGNGILASQSGSTGTATITDAGTEWQINGELKVGDNGNGVMSVENGGFVSLAGNLAIADSGGTSTLTLDGNGSRMTGTGTSVTIGGKGDGTLIVQDAADAIFSGASVSLGENDNSTGTLTVQGSNTLMSAGSLTIGGSGTGTLTVQNSASLSTGSNISVGEQATGTGTATIDGSTVTDAGTLTVGGYGTGTLTIQNSGTLDVQGNDITLGEQNTGNGTLNLVGIGATLAFAGDMTIGKSGAGTFTVSGGAQFSGSAMTLASGSGFGGASTGGTGELDINGTSSVLLSQDLTIGKYGVGTLAMVGGAVLANKGDATLGSQPATEGSATLNSGSNWTVGGSLTVGSQGTGSVTIEGGSSLIANGDSLTGLPIFLA